jgi:hypothetical protein
MGEFRLPCLGIGLWLTSLSLCKGNDYNAVFAGNERKLASAGCN